MRRQCSDTRSSRRSAIIASYNISFTSSSQAFNNSIASPPAPTALPVGMRSKIVRNSSKVSSVLKSHAPSSMPMSGSKGSINASHHAAKALGHAPPSMSTTNRCPMSRSV